MVATYCLNYQQKRELRRNEQNLGNNKSGEEVYTAQYKHLTRTDQNTNTNKTHSK